MDDLIAMDQWPSVTSDYIIARGEQGQPELSVTWRFNAGIYLPASDPNAARDVASTDLGKFRTIYYQLTQPDVTVTLNSTMQSDVVLSESASHKDVMVGFVLSIINFLIPISEGQPPPPAPRDAVMSQPVADQNPHNLFALVVEVQISQSPDLVASRVPANAGKADLQEFARQLETAFPNLKVLAAAPKKSLDQTAEEIWIARFSATETGIAFNIDGTKPSFFAAAPLARNLLSRPDVLVYPYEPGRYLAGEIPVKTSQNSVDLDQMGRAFLAAMETVLGPQFSCATPAPDDPPDPDKSPYQAIVAAKVTLATAIGNHVVSVLETVEPPLGREEAGEQLRRQLLVDLTAAYTVVILQYPVEVTHSQYAGDDPFAPQLSGKPVAQSLARKDAFSFSTGKFSLAKRLTGTHLTFSFETNREQQGRGGTELDDVFTIDLFHEITALEHEIHLVNGSDGDLASSWLTFVLPKTLISLGEQTIPVPLRAHPAAPSLSEHTFIPLMQFVGELTDATGEELILQARQWKYVCQYEYVGAAHDKILASIKLNVPAGGSLKTKFSDADNPDLFASLVQFTAAYPGIAKDLDQYLVTGSDDKFASSAMRSFAWLAQRTANAWLTWQNDRVLYSAVLPDVPEYHFVITQQAEEFKGVNALIVTVSAEGALRLPELPNVEIAGYKTELLSQTPELAKYYFVSEADLRVLTYEDGRNLSKRGLAFSHFDVLKVENAWAGMTVKRNENLLPDQNTNPDFVFQSPVVRFVNALTPLLDADVEIDIAGFTPERPAALPVVLSNFLIAFFEAAETAGNEQRTIRLGASFSNGLQSAETSDSTPAPDLSVTVPILLTTPTSISILNLSPESQFVSSVSETINAWFSQNTPSGLQDSGKLWFDLSVYSSLSESQLPVLRIRRLFLETKILKNI